MSDTTPHWREHGVRVVHSNELNLNTSQRLSEKG